MKSERSWEVKKMEGLIIVNSGDESVSILVQDMKAIADLKKAQRLLKDILGDFEEVLRGLPEAKEEKEKT